MSQKIVAGAPFPKLSVKNLKGGELELGTPAEGKDWQLVLVYRGKHCPLCTKYLAQLDQLKDQFYDLGVDIVAVSGDPLEKAQEQIGKIEAGFKVGYDLSIDQMKDLGLYISNPRSPQETDRPFAEPGFFVVNHQGTVQMVDISNAPFLRPDLEAAIRGIKFIRNPENNYPIRGTYS